MLNRPKHLLQRPITGCAFGEDAVLVRTRAGHRNRYGEWIPGPVERIDIRLASVPVSGNARGDGLIRRLVEGGVQLDASRLFWTTEVLYPVSRGGTGDVIEYRGQKWQVRQTQRWHDYSESLGERVEDDQYVIPD